MPNSLSDRTFCCQSAEVGSLIGSAGNICSLKVGEKVGFTESSPKIRPGDCRLIYVLKFNSLIATEWTLKQH
ncbi:hypothetical protein H6G41_12485 [Tolypothrix sp. FACHB-123]|uniref:hypothetical protein n=1 Tax=Tolypothrix sp. FACHB-123 TaxID=2692868 RepID=UPI0016869A71|nr:hypothetical protein [Tolypothrix sp. FACHB-123]MBD2355423.1 hypothetical protein [Tolypothrix sp. FACHB-123]